jgi:hypothetical protein
MNRDFSVSMLLLLGVALASSACRKSETSAGQMIPSFCGMSMAGRSMPRNLRWPESLGLTNQIVTSRVASVRIRVLGTSAGSYVVALSNLSPLGVMATEFSVRSNNPSTRVSKINESSRADQSPLIGPGETCSEFVQEDSPVELTAAIFSDGSNEGEPEAAAELKGRRTGYQSQRQRINALINPILEDKALDSPAKIVRIRAGLTSLDGKPDENLVREMRIQFPGLGADVSSADLQAGYRGGTQTVWSLLWQYEHRAKDAPPDETLAKWLGGNWR